MSQVLILIAVNGVAWFIIHFGVSVGLLKVSDLTFSKHPFFKKLFVSYDWENEGEFWEQKTGVKEWKDRLPDGASLFGMGYKKKHLAAKSQADYPKFILETKRAELTHWMILLPVPLFFLWNPLWAAWLNFLYALVINVPFIIIQRYNRPRLARIQKMKERKRTFK